MKHLKTLNKYIWRYKWYFLFGILFVAGSNLFRVAQPKIIGRALDRLIELLKGYDTSLGIDSQPEIYSEIANVLGRFALIVLALAVMMGVLMYFMRQTIVVMSRLIERDLKKDIFTHYEALDQAFYRKNSTGDLMSRITEDVSKVRMYLGPAILYGINLSSLVILALVSMLSVSPKLTLWTLMPLPILSVSIYYVSSIINKKSERIQAKLAELNSFSQEAYSGIRVIKSYVKEKLFGQEFIEKCEEYKTDTLSLAQVNALFFPLIILLIGVSTVLTVYIGGIYVDRGIITTGNIAEFVIYINMLTWPVTSIGWVASIIQQAAASQKRINEFLNTEPSIKSPHREERALEGELEFRNVSFTYPDTGVKALKNVSFKIEPGQKVLIVGKTASGKTTVVDLLVRLFDTDTGSIIIDGRDIRELDLHNLRKRIGYIPQDGFLFSDTVLNNIAFGQEHNNPETAEFFARKASVHKDIMKLDKGYQTLIGERGVTLSGGQKQRVAIARTLIKDPDIVLIDDSLSAVDSETEKTIVEYLNAELKDKTALIITHRLHGSMEYDKVLVLEEGELVEEGTHEELLEAEGYYYEMYERQLVDESASSAATE